MITLVARKIQTLLIARDNDLRESIERNLNVDGFKIFAVSDGPAGVEVAHRHKLRLILIEETPDSKQIVLAIKLNHNTSHIPVFMIREDNKTSENARGAEVSTDGYVAKTSIGEGLPEIVKFKLENYEAVSKRPDRKARQGKKILIIDDEEHNRSLGKYTLQQYGFEVYTAEDGPSGIRAARKYKPHAILLDVMMPGMDGWEVLANLRLNKKTKDILVILLKAGHTLNDIDKAHARRVDDFILKPFDTETLGKTVESKLQGSKRR